MQLPKHYVSFFWKNAENCILVLLIRKKTEISKNLKTNNFWLNNSLYDYHFYLEIIFSVKFAEIISHNNYRNMNRKIRPDGGVRWVHKKTFAGRVACA